MPDFRKLTSPPLWAAIGDVIVAAGRGQYVDHVARAMRFIFCAAGLR